MIESGTSDLFPPEHVDDDNALFGIMLVIESNIHDNSHRPHPFHGTLLCRLAGKKIPFQAVHFKSGESPCALHYLNNFAIKEFSCAWTFQTLGEMGLRCCKYPHTGSDSCHSKLRAGKSDIQQIRFKASA